MPPGATRRRRRRDAGRRARACSRARRARRLRARQRRPRRRHRQAPGLPPVAVSSPIPRPPRSSSRDRRTGRLIAAEFEGDDGGKAAWTVKFSRLGADRSDRGRALSGDHRFRRPRHRADVRRATSPSTERPIVPYLIAHHEITSAGEDHDQGGRPTSGGHVPGQAGRRFRQAGSGRRAFQGQRVVFVGVPGAFTSTCHVAHIPQFVDQRQGNQGEGRRPHRRHGGQRSSRHADVGRGARRQGQDRFRLRRRRRLCPRPRPRRRRWPAWARASGASPCSSRTAS